MLAKKYTAKELKRHDCVSKEEEREEDDGERGVVDEMEETVEDSTDATSNCLWASSENGQQRILARNTEGRYTMVSKLTND